MDENSRTVESRRVGIRISAARCSSSPRRCAHRSGRPMHALHPAALRSDPVASEMVPCCIGTCRARAAGRSVLTAGEVGAGRFCRPAGRSGGTARGLCVAARSFCAATKGFCGAARCLGESQTDAAPRQNDFALRQNDFAPRQREIAASSGRWEWRGPGLQGRKMSWFCHKTTLQRRKTSRRGPGDQGLRSRT